MKKLISFTKRVKTPQSATAPSASDRRRSFGSSSAKSLVISVVHGGYNIDLTQVDASFTKLHKGCLLNYDEGKIRKYLKQGADPNLLDNKSRSSPLHLAVVNDNLSLVKALLENKANIDLVDGEGKTPLMKAAECKREGLLQFFIFNGADPNIASADDGNTALHIALIGSFVEGAQILLKGSANVDINKRNFLKESALHLVVKNPELKLLLPVVLDRKAMVDAKDDRGRTPLMIAAANGNKDAVELLVRRGANVDQCDIAGNTPADLAKKNGYSDIAALITGNGMVGGAHRASISSRTLDPWSDSDESSDGEGARKNAASNFNPVIEQLQKIQGIKSSASSLQPSAVKSSHTDKNLMQQTIVEEYENPTETPTPNAEFSTDMPKPADIRLQWHSSSDSDDDDEVPAFLRNKRRYETDPLLTPSQPSPNGTLGRDETMNDKTEVWLSNPTSPKKAATSKETLDGAENDALSQLDRVLGEDVANADFIQQIKDLLDEEIQENDELDAMLMENVYSVPPPPVPVPNHLVDGESLPSSRRSSIQSITFRSPPGRTSGNSSRRGSLVDTNDKSKPVNKLPPVKSLIRAPVISFSLDDEDEPVSKPKIFTVPLLRQEEQRIMSPIRSDDEWQEMQSHQNEMSAAAAVKSLPVLKQLEAPVSVIPNIAIVPEQKQPPVSQTSSQASHAITMSTDADLIKRIEELEKNLVKEKLESKSKDAQLESSTLALEKVKLDFQETFKQKLELESTVFKLSSEVSKFTYEKETIVSELEKVRRDNKLLRSGKDQTQSELGALSEENERKLRENAELRKQVEKLRLEVMSKPRDSSVSDDMMHEVVQKNNALNQENEDLRKKWKSAQAELTSQKSNYETRIDELETRVSKDSIEKDQLKRSLSSLQEKLFVCEERLEKKSRELTSNESRNNQELLNSIRDLSGVVLRLEDKTTDLSASISETRESTLTAAVVETAQKQIDVRMEMVFDQTRALLKEISGELSEIKDLAFKQTPIDMTREVKEERGEEVVNSLYPFEKKIADLQSSLERLEDNMQMQELQLLVGSRQNYEQHSQTTNRGYMLTNCMSQLLPENRPKSLFVQTLLQMQTSKSQPLLSNRHSDFYIAKNNLKTKISSLKSDLGVFTPNFDLYDNE